MIRLKNINKDSIRVILTDSGLGGLSICAALEKTILTHKIFKKAELIFFNSLADKECGYNKLESHKKKVEVFNNALNGMKKLYNPNLIMIACNTLSVIFPFTEFARNSDSSVVGIVDFGVDMILKKLTDNPKSLCLLFGTPTTINSNVHAEKLITAGIEKERILSQPCRFLESEIQENSQSTNVRQLIYKYTQKIISRITSTPTIIFPALCCTHYSYSENLFEDVFAKLFDFNYEIINPNIRMSEYFNQSSGNKNINSSITSVKVVSKVEITEGEKKSIGDKIKFISPNTYQALQNYSYNRALFEFNPRPKKFY
ncbi:hypothetical protein ACFLS9_07680 [Bacteroidota bacterium]